MLKATKKKETTRDQKSVMPVINKLIRLYKCELYQKSFKYSINVVS